MKTEVKAQVRTSDGPQSTLPKALVSYNPAIYRQSTAVLSAHPGSAPPTTAEKATGTTSAHRSWTINRSDQKAIHLSPLTTPQSPTHRKSAHLQSAYEAPHKHLVREGRDKPLHCTVFFCTRPLSFLPDSALMDNTLYPLLIILHFPFFHLGSWRFP